MFFFHIKCEKNTKSFVLQMLAAHNVAIILNILRCLNQNQDFKQHWGKSIFMSFHQKKKKLCMFATIASETVCQISTSDWQ